MAQIMLIKAADLHNHFRTAVAAVILSYLDGPTGETRTGAEGQQSHSKNGFIRRKRHTKKLASLLRTGATATAGKCPPSPFPSKSQEVIP
jgi:hypothetical protein